MAKLRKYGAKKKLSRSERRKKMRKEDKEFTIL